MEIDELGFDEKYFINIDTLVQSHIQQRHIPGAMVVVSRFNTIAYHKSFGYLNYDTKQELPKDALFRLESMTKPITTTAVMILCDQGLLHLDDAVSKYIPAFAKTQVFVEQTEDGMRCEKPHNPITIRQLLSHTAGLSYGNYDHVVDAHYRQALMELGFDATGTPSTPITNAAFVECIAQLPLLYHPGQGWQYSFSVDVAGYLVEVISGLPLPDYLRKHLFDPLEMEDTIFRVPDDRLSRFGALYNPHNDGFRVLDSPKTSRWRHPLFIEGGGGLISTARDYLRFCQMLLNSGQLDGKRILEESTVREMMQNQVPEKVLPIKFQNSDTLNGCGFGLGFDVLLDVKASGRLGSRGMVSWSGAASTGFWIDPELSIICLVFAQVIPNTLLHLELMDIVYQALNHKVTLNS